jgi:long-chain acyl-CoA synthetase
VNTITDLWEQAEQAHPNRLALIDGSDRLTYQQTGQAIRALAANLAVCWGIQPGDVVALMAPNCIAFVVSYFAITRLGAIVQPIDERLAADEVRAVLRDAQAERIIVHQSLLPKLESVLPDMPQPNHLLKIGAGTSPDDSFAHWVTHRPATPAPDMQCLPMPESMAELMYTSGTTGEPKGVMRSHRNVLAASCNAIRGFGYRPDDVIAIAMPLSHSSALNSQMMPLLEQGGTLVLLSKFDAPALIALIRSESVTCMRAVPAMLRMLLALPDFKATALPSLRLIVNSSAPIDPAGYVALKQRFADIQVLNSYGLTEASTCTVLADAQALSHPASVGMPIEGVNMRICDEAGHEVPRGNEGEIYVSGEHVFAGYRNNPQKTSAVLIDGWLRTGDMAHQDEQGLIYLHGRRDDVINCAGRKFAPADVENCILLLREVQETVVIGAPHPVLGQVVKAYVVLKPGVEPNARLITRHCARNLPSHKIPFYVEFATELPHNSAGKVMRRKLAV